MLVDANFWPILFFIICTFFNENTPYFFRLNRGRDIEFYVKPCVFSHKKEEVIRDWLILSYRARILHTCVSGGGEFNGEAGKGKYESLQNKDHSNVDQYTHLIICSHF